MPAPFSYTEYDQILERILATGRYCDYAEAVVRDVYVVLRHDVEFSPDRAYRLHLLENKRGLRSCWTRSIRSASTLGRSRDPMHYDVVVFGAKDTTQEIVRYLCEDLRFKVSLLVTVSEQVLRNTDVAGHSDLSVLGAEYGVELFEVDDYAMKDDATAALFSQHTFGIGICMGWQRLIPKSVLDRFGSGIFGFHGSCGYLPFGRGRSPLNWSLIHGDRRFILNLFRYDEAADSPNVFMKQMFEINAFDTIRTLQYKNMLCAKVMLRALLAAHQSGSIPIRSDSKDFDAWYPKRTPADGEIDFRLRGREIHNLVRAVTRPFAGAFGYVDGRKVTIWRAQPFDSIMEFSAYAVGEVIDVFDGCPIIRLIDGALLITEYEGDPLRKGDHFQTGRNDRR